MNSDDIMVLKKAQEHTTYQIPPKVIADLVDMPATPSLQISPDHKWLVFLERPSLPSIQEVAQKEIRLAGLRINPKTNGASRSYYYTNIKIRKLNETQTYEVMGMPPAARIENIGWSPDSNYLSFTNTTEAGIALWVIKVAEQQAQQLTPPILNDAIGGVPYKWQVNSTGLFLKTIPEHRPDVPSEQIVPLGPIVQKSDGEAAMLKTYQDLLRNEHDEVLFSYYTTACLQYFDLETRNLSQLGIEGILNDFAVSPDGTYLLLSILKKPFSYQVPYNRFPFDVLVYSSVGKLVKRIADIPLAETIPQSFGAVREGIRNVLWRPDQSAMLCWVVAKDGGDPKRASTYRDQLFFWNAPFTDTSIVEGPKFKLRYGGTTWYNDELAITYEWWWKSRKIVTSCWKPGQLHKERRVIFDRSWEDVYSNPGTFELERNHLGKYILMRSEDGEHLYLRGEGASPEGNKPFIDTLNLKTLQRKRLWQSVPPYYEQPLLILNKNTPLTCITRRETQTIPPNYYIRKIEQECLKPITDFLHPYEALKNVQRELIRYKRADGVELTGTLYLPEHYAPEKDGTLPVLMWAYPREYKSKKAAGQLKTSPYKFIQISWGSPLFWVTQGYAVFNDFGMPIVGEQHEEPNETFIEQLQMSAEAAIHTLVKKGIADPKRIAVGGHSYGAFMTANLLAHTNLFAAGIARSGAYNRTLTPFGFQSEERTFWEAPEVYMKMSPFANAHKIKTPLLLIHGEADNNAGTYPMQSERMFTALKGHGAITRLVMLPHESHGYRARESVLHMLWEMNNWLERYVK
ncbi:MAG: prolyl oligopeptidase family serine peptidase [Bacteroidota bacterium]